MGTAERVWHNRRVNLDISTNTCVSRAYAQRRADLAGRDKIGKCFRMYSEETLKTDSLASVPKSELMGGYSASQGHGSSRSERFRLYRHSESWNAFSQLTETSRLVST